jgi:hypothetical protein
MKKYDYREEIKGSSFYGTKVEARGEHSYLTLERVLDQRRRVAKYKQRMEAVDAMKNIWAKKGRILDD